MLRGPGRAVMNRPILCYVTDRQGLPAAGADPATALLERIAQAARAGVDWIQLRERNLEGRALLDLATKAVAACAAAAPGAANPARLLVNDRLDVAWAAQAAGVHLGERSVPAVDVTRWRKHAGRADFLVGVSCHSLAAATQAAADGADYLFFGPVFPTPSKQAFGAPQGLQKLERVCRGVSLPVLAIGGITAQNAGSCLQAGAAGIAAIRLFQQAEEIAAADLTRIRQ
jgi:thiamine-phosphate pyrophosphorylase